MLAVSLGCARCFWIFVDWHHVLDSSSCIIMLRTRTKARSRAPRREQERAFFFFLLFSFLLFYFLIFGFVFSFSCRFHLASCDSFNDWLPVLLTFVVQYPFQTLTFPWTPKWLLPNTTFHNSWFAFMTPMLYIHSSSSPLNFCSSINEDTPDSPLLLPILLPISKSPSIKIALCSHCLCSLCLAPNAVKE